jgi:hypothetical protein
VDLCVRLLHRPKRRTPVAKPVPDHGNCPVQPALPNPQTRLRFRTDPAPAGSQAFTTIQQASLFCLRCAGPSALGCTPQAIRSLPQSPVWLHPSPQPGRPARLGFAASCRSGVLQLPSRSHVPQARSRLHPVKQLRHDHSPGLPCHQGARGTFTSE